MADLDKTITWTCHKCQHSNERSGGIEKCSKCQEQRQIKEVFIKSPQLTALGWTCKRCMYDNWFYKPSCESCGKVNIPLQRLFSTDDNKWHCNVCTYLNRDDLTACELCTAARQHSANKDGTDMASIPEEDVNKSKTSNDDDLPRIGGIDGYGKKHSDLKEPSANGIVVAADDTPKGAKGHNNKLDDTNGSKYKDPYAEGPKKRDPIATEPTKKDADGSGARDKDSDGLGARKKHPDGVRAKEKDPGVWEPKKIDHDANGPHQKHIMDKEHENKRSAGHRKKFPHKTDIEQQDNGVDDFVWIKRFEEPDDDSDKQEWECNRCTLLNKMDKKFCDACKLSRYANKQTENNDKSEAKNKVAKDRSKEGKKDGQSKKVDQTDIQKEEKPVKGWTCDECTLVNENYRKNCSACYAVRPTLNKKADIGGAIDAGKQQQWECPYCSFINDSSETLCKGCTIYRRQPDTKIVKPKPESKEKQIKQTSKPSDKKDGNQSNDAHDGKGEKVFGGKNIEKEKKNGKSGEKLQLPLPKDRHSTELPDSSKKWKCKHCTLENSDSDKHCQICRSVRPQAKERGYNNRRIRAQMRSVKIVDLQAQEEKTAMERWNNIVEFCRKNKSMFVDDSFRPSLEALYFKPNKEADQKNSQWLRCHDIHTEDSAENKNDWVVYRSRPLPEDIKQGSLGDCWFLCALAVLAERKELLDRIILTKTFCKEGAYQIRLCKDGRWKVVIIDDWFLCDQYKRLKYSKASRKQLWVPLIEKAAAKLHGCYQALTSGRSVEALSLLTGEPCETIDLQEREDDDMEIDKAIIWSKLVNARENKFLLGTSCGSGKMVNVDHKKYEAVGLIPLHAYSVLDVQDVQGNQLVKIRNPWGTVSWKGDWSDRSQKWQNINSAVKNQIQLDGNKKGIFWMCLDDYMKYFDSVEICKARTDWHEQRIKGVFPPHAADPWKFVNIALFERTEVCFGLFQKSERGMEHSKTKSFVDLFIVVLENYTDEQRTGQFKKVISTSRRCARSFVGCEVTLEPGAYTVACLAFKQWRTGMPAVSPLSIGKLKQLNKDYILSLHSSRTLITEEINSHVKSYSHGLADMIIQLTIEKGKKQKLEDDCTLWSLWWYGAIFVIENSSKKMYAQVKFDTSTSSNLLSTRGSFVTMDCIPPQHRQVIMLLTPVDAIAGWSLNRSTCHIMSKKPGLFRDWEAPPGVEHQPAIDTPDVAGLHSLRPIL